MPSPSTPIRELVLADIASALDDITAGAAYFVTPSKVTRLASLPTQMLERLTYIVEATGDVPSAEEGAASATGITAWNMTVTVHAFIRRELASDTYANQIIHDIQKAVLTDRTRSTYAMNTVPAGIVVITDDMPDGVSSLDVSFVVTYRHQFADPSAQE